MESPPPSTLRWVKASMSTNLNACVELASDGDMIALRDSKDPSTFLRFTQLEVMAFIDGAKQGEFDHLIDTFVARQRQEGLVRDDIRTSNLPPVCVRGSEAIYSG